jgi:hypothetical protein
MLAFVFPGRHLFCVAERHDRQVYHLKEPIGLNGLAERRRDKRLTICTKRQR